MQNMPPKIHAIEIGCKNLVKHYATKIVSVNIMQKPKPKFVGTELTSRSHIWNNALQMEEIN